MAAKRIYGIDLGTTYSCISYVDESGRPVVINNVEGDSITPSIVYFESPNNTVVGKEAKNASKLYPERVVSFIKREMGNPTFTRVIDGREYHPEELSSFTLKKLVRDASKELGEEITDVVITCPAYFGMNERKATKNAGELAGLNVRHILSEPTAAAISYAKSKPEDKVVLVYDLGGGTFDVSVVVIKDGRFRVLYTTGNHTLGGKDWDDVVTAYLAEGFAKEYPDKSSPLDTPDSAQLLALAAEDAKRSLSSKQKTVVAVSHEGVVARVELAADKLEEMTSQLIERTIDMTKDVVEEVSKLGYKIEQVLLVGGSSRMPVVARRIKELVGIEPTLHEPDLAVAKGAALLGVKILAGDIIKDILVREFGEDAKDLDLNTVDPKKLEEAAAKAKIDSSEVFGLAPGPGRATIGTFMLPADVCARGFGVVALKSDKTEYVARLIKSNTVIPVEVTEKRFGTLEPNQTGVRIAVMESAATVETDRLEDNIEIGVGHIENLPAGLPAMTPIHVTFRLSKDGTLEVNAVEPSSGKKCDIKIVTSSVMNAEQVKQSREALAFINVS